MRVGWISDAGERLHLVDDPAEESTHMTIGKCAPFVTSYKV
jgi:hypothetical protein